MTAHDNIDNLLVADLHGELSDSERSELQNHLLDCAICRQAHQETKIMNQLLEEKLENERPDPAFENRMLTHFRNWAPKKSPGMLNWLAILLRSRVTQSLAAACILILLGSWLTRGPRFAFLGLPDEQMVAEMTKDNSLLSLRTRLGWPEQKAKMEEAARKQTAAGGSLADLSDAAPAKSATAAKPLQEIAPDADRVVAAGSNIPSAEEAGPNPTLTLHRDLINKSKAPAEESVVETRAIKAPPDASDATNPALPNRKLIRNATVDLEIASFDTAVQKITAFANQERGYVATTSSEKQENGKLKGDIVVKVLPENLDRFLQKIRGLGELKNQTLGTEDVTKAYFDTESRLKNAHVMESRLVDMLKTKTGKVSDLLQVEKELGRVREEIEKMQGELKFWDSQVQFATVTIALAEKDLEEPATFLLKERAQLSLYTPEVEKVYNDIKGLASSKVQITNAHLERNNAGQVSAQIGMLIAPEESDSVVAKTKSMGRVEGFQTQTQRISQGGEGLSESAKTKRDKFELNITITRDEQEQALQQTNLRIRTSAVDDKTKSLRDLATKQNGRVRSSSFSRDPNGREFANVTLRVPMKNYNALMQSLDSLGKVEDVSVQRQDRFGQDVDLANAPADLTIQIYSQGNIVSSDTGIFATLRNTIGQGAGALMWSARMIGVAIAFLAPWVIALVAVIWIVRRVVRARRNKS